MSQKKGKFYESDEYKATQDEWYAKLKEEGFKDIEATESGIPLPAFRNKKGQNYENHFQFKQAYYSKAEDTLRMTDWSKLKPRDKDIWELHTQGLSVRAIAKQLKLWPNTVYRSIKRISNPVKITQKSLNKIEKGLEEIAKNNKELKALAEKQARVLNGDSNEDN